MWKVFPERTGSRQIAAAPLATKLPANGCGSEQLGHMGSHCGPWMISAVTADVYMESPQYGAYACCANALQGARNIGMTYMQSSHELPEQMSRLIAVSVVVCTHNRAASLVKTLESIRQMCIPPDLGWELI